MKYILLIVCTLLLVGGCANQLAQTEDALAGTLQTIHASKEAGLVTSKQVQEMKPSVDTAVSAVFAAEAVSPATQPSDVATLDEKLQLARDEIAKIKDALKAAGVK